MVKEQVMGAGGLRYQPSSTKETPKGKTLTKGSKTGKSALAKETVEEPIAEVIMDDAGDDLQPPRTPTSDPEWNKRQVVLDQPSQPWFNQMVSAIKDPITFNDLMATPINLSSIELEYNFQECFNALTDNLDWNNPKGDRYSFDISKPLPLQGPSSHRTVAADYFFNNDLEYLKTSDPKVSKFSKQNVYSTKVILGVKSVSVKKLHGHDMLLLVVQHKLFHLHGNVIVDFIVALRMFTRSLILKRCVKDLQLGVESYQKKLNITKPQKTFPEIEFKEPYAPSYDPPRIIYEGLDKHKRVLRANELYKFSNGTLKSVRDEIHQRVLDFHLDYNLEMPKRKWTSVDKKRSGLMIELIDKQLTKTQNRRDLPRNILLVSVEVHRYNIKRSKSENKGIVLTEMELVLEQTQQGTSHEVLVSTEGVEELKRIVKMKGEKKEALHTLCNAPLRKEDVRNSACIQIGRDKVL
uniref:Uncharacterized protein n=1 Tax=Tanacetum cinerariifolium TaxID=118510 RepID=A0A699IGK7_TANCI|nr:hypothetical protein [Tanacetum cinerariifolium]